MKMYGYRDLCTQPASTCRRATGGFARNNPLLFVWG